MENLTEGSSVGTTCGVFKPAECVRRWCSSNNVPFECFVSPWFDSLDLLLHYNDVKEHNTQKAHKGWFWFFGYSNGSMASNWGFDLFINIENASSNKGTVIVRVSSGKFASYCDREFYVFQNLKRRLEYATYAQIPKTQDQFGAVETNRWYNYYIAHDVKYRDDDKCNGQILEENLHGLIVQAEKKDASANGRMYGYRFSVPSMQGLLAELLDPLVS